ncbi:MAG TPA: Uma2 family endonuclease [Pseudonocardiaceae bacterium]
MTAATHSNPSTDQILALHDRFQSPGGHKAEVIEGTIVVSPSRSGRNALIYSKLQAQLNELIPARVAVTAIVTLEMAATDERYVPDILVAANDVLDSDEWLLPADQAELVAEIVSPSNARHDRVVKLRGYAASGVPVYLLVDPLERSVTLFCEPVGQSYQQMRRVPFGASIALPAPYQGKIDTAAFT